MKRLFFVISLFSIVSLCPARADDSKGALIWVGLDYSKVKMIGTLDFREPDEIFPGFLNKWNAVFIQEMLPKLEKMAPNVRTDMAAVQARNAKASPTQVIHEDGSTAEMVTPTDFTEKQIADLVQSYDLKSKDGIGLVFIMDRLVKAQQTGCFYVVFFDVGSRKVLFSERCCEKAGGAGFRNYWFSPIKRVVEKQLPGMYKTALSKANS